MELRQLKATVEAMLFACGDPVDSGRLAEVLELPVEDVERVLVCLADEYASQERGICLLSIENRWQLATKTEYAREIKLLLDNRRNTPLSPAALEVLAIIAYNQPVSRSFVEQVRGVDSSSTIQTLAQKGLVEEAGRLDLPGRPISFRTTDTFLRTFGLKSLTDLPPLHEDDYPLEAIAAGVQETVIEQEAKE
ncbi:SMC-Scp complex subunit ScpB [uncultured Ruthenibacterium sp.]|uniref:SMC-Scp complex subunit ScpB n=1 Tax=uncultured Ruthenibacterium sp. TaxID=1905347 RepID=UPI00349E55BC